MCACFTHDYLQKYHYNEHEYQRSQLENKTLFSK